MIVSSYLLYRMVSSKMQQVYPEQALLKELLLCPKLKSAINNQGKMPKTVWHVEDEFKSLTA